MTPRTRSGLGIPHYHGDIIRQLLMFVAGVMLVASPFYTTDLKLQFPFILIGAVVFVAVAALTNPHNTNIIVADAVASGVGLLIYQTWALFNYADSSWVEFALREGIALILMTVFYFSMKTLRAMLLGKVGKREEVGEFDTE